MRPAQRALAASLPGLLVGGAIALSPDPAGPWVYELGQRLLYIHVPLAWVAYLGFAISAVAALAVLRKGSRRAGRVMRASNEATTIAGTAALLTGLAWSYEFTFEPISDPKVLSTLVLTAALAGLWHLANTTPPPRRDPVVAAVTLVAFAAVPASYFASRLTTPHPDFLTDTTLSAEMGWLLLAATAGFTLLHLLIVRTRTRQLSLMEARAW